MTKFLIIGDLHGNKPKIHFKNFDAIIAPGDFCSDAPRTYMFKSMKLWMKDPNSKVRWYDLVGKSKARKMVKKSLADGRKILKYLNSFGVPVYVIPGNWDWTGSKREKWSFIKKNYYKEYLIKGLKNIINVEHKAIDTGNEILIGYGICPCPEYPQYKEDLKQFNSKQLKKIKNNYNATFKKINKLFLKAKKNKPVIFLSHNVPFNTPIDKIVNKRSPKDGYHYGSLIARNLIEKHNPLICVGAHMHEHFGKCKLKKTVCMNAGFGSYVNTSLEVKGNKIKSLKFYKGR